MKAARKLRNLQRPQSLIGNVRQFLTPQVWKQARQANARRRARPRWDLQPLVLIMMAMTWTAGDSQAERFETARGFYVTCSHARKRPGATIQGFQKALSRIPIRQFQALAAGVRQEIRTRYAQRLLVEGFEPMGCDGSRIECPRTTELETRLGQAGKKDAAPTLWVTAFVHLSTGLLWSWQIGPGTAAEQVHLRQMLGTLSHRALIVCDAAYMGYDLVQAILRSRRSFLFRMSSRVHLYTPGRATLETWSEGPVLYWPKTMQDEGRPPIECRLIRVPATGQRKRDVWLLTDILDPARLSVATAARFYRWRWRNEGVFIVYKRTINKLKFSSRTVRLVRREAELSLLATQILLAHADLALRPEGTTMAGEPAISPRKVLIEIRKELEGRVNRRNRSYGVRLEGCRAERREQTSAKATRDWPRRKPHKPPKPPKLHTLSKERKARLGQNLSAAWQ
jgi:hypothetical protein